MTTIHSTTDKALETHSLAPGNALEAGQPSANPSRLPRSPVVTATDFPGEPAPAYANTPRPIRRADEVTGDGHIDNSWDAFKRGLGDSLKNPVGWTAGEIVEAEGGTKEQIELAKHVGDSPLGEGLAKLAKQMGATDAQVEHMRGLGKSVEGLIPGYGQARLGASLVSDVVKPPEGIEGIKGVAEIDTQFKQFPGYVGRTDKTTTSATEGKLPADPGKSSLQEKPEKTPPVPATAASPTPAVKTGDWHDYAASVDIKTTSPMTTGVEKGTYVVDGKTYIPLEGKNYQVSYDQELKSWKIVDPGNPFAFHGSQPVRLNEQGQWETVASPKLQGGGWFDKKKSAAKNEPSTGAGTLTEPERYVQQLLDRRKATPGHVGAVESVAQLKGLDFKIPAKVYRAHPGQTAPEVAKHGLQRAAGGNATGDDYLAGIIKHTARTGGSAGEVMSLTSEESVANRFSRNGTVPVFTIDTTKNPTAFRTVPDIIVKDGQRLVKEGKVTQATLLQAMDKIAEENESEVFYVAGDIPRDMMVMPSSAKG